MPDEVKSWMPLYWGDYFRGTQLFQSATEHGAYLLLIAYCWHHGALPPHDNDRRRIAKCTRRQWQLIRATVLAKFDDEGRNERCSEERSYAIEKSRIARANAMHRHNGRSANGMLPTPTQKGKKDRKPLHGQKTRDGKRVWCDIGTDDFEAYAQDYRRNKGSEPALNWSGSGAWFNWHGEPH